MAATIKESLRAERGHRVHGRGASRGQIACDDSDGEKQRGHPPEGSTVERADVEQPAGDQAAGRHGQDEADRDAERGEPQSFAHDQCLDD